jgi:hypothetical protein
VLKPAAVIETFVMGNQLDASVERDWQDLRRDLDELARAYGVAWDWRNPRAAPASPGPGALNGRLTGTYQLDNGRGDDPRVAAEQATRTAPATQRDRAYQRLMNRLEAPETIAIDRQGNRVSMATSRGPE